MARARLIDNDGIEWWRRTLHGAPTLLDLPVDRPNYSNAGAEWYEADFDHAARHALASAPSLGATPASMLLGAVGIWASRTTGQERVVLGTGIETERGAWVVPIAIDADGATTFAALVHQLEGQIDAAARRDPVDLHELAAALGAQIVANRTPLAQVVVLQGSFADELRSGEPYDIVVGFDPCGEATRGIARFRREVFTKDEAHRIVGQLHHVLEQALRHEQMPIRDLSALSPSDAAQLDAINATAVSLPNLDLAELLARQSANTPDRVAVVFGSNELTYGELDERAERLANALVAAGVEPGDRVVVSLERSLDLVAALIAILKAGAAYVAVEMNLPAGRVEAILARVRPRLAVVTPANRPGVGPVPTVTLDELEANAEIVPPRGVLTRTLDDIAYVSFTSGSTGEPKGVEVPHRGIVRLALGCYADLGADRRVLQFAPVAFDASTWELWCTLANGASLHVFPPGIPSPAELASFIREHGINSLWLTAGWFQLLVDHEPECFEGVREVLTGGDVVSATHVSRLLRAYPGIRVVNGYGPTENTTFSCTYTTSRPDDVGTSVPIGRPITGTRVYVVDHRLRPVPYGAEGELCVAGDGLAKGYAGDAPQTAERFVVLRRCSGELVYRTGDRVRFSGDGQLQFLGRRDEQVKVRGYRVELEEVRQALYRIPGVADVGVAVLGDSSADKHLAAFVVLAPGAPTTADELRARVKEILPAYMVPTTWSFVDAIPITANGKVDRAALVKQLTTSTIGSPGQPAPRPSSAGNRSTVLVVRSAWEETLGHSAFGDDDDFFNVGGTSLRAASLVARLRELTGTRIALRMVFDVSTVASMASWLDDPERGA